MAKLNVCMCTRNREKILNNTLKNMLSQTYINYDFLVCDDMSQDNTITMLMTIRDNFPMFKLCQPTTPSYINAHNRVLNYMKEHYNDAEYVAWVDDDDLCANNRLEIQMNFLDSHPEVDVVTCTTVINKNQVIANTINTLDHKQITDLLKTNRMGSICHFQSVMFRKKCLEKFTNNKYFFDEYMGGYAGEGFLYTLFALGYKFANISDTVYFYNIGEVPGSMSNTLDPLFAKSINELSLTQRKKEILSLFEKYNPQEVEEKPKRGRKKKVTETT